MGMRIRGLNVSASTAFHSQELGFRTILIEDASRGIKVMKSNSDHVSLVLGSRSKSQTANNWSCFFCIYTAHTGARHWGCICKNPRGARVCRQVQRGNHHNNKHQCQPGQKQFYQHRPQFIETRWRRWFREETGDLSLPTNLPWSAGNRMLLLPFPS